MYALTCWSVFKCPLTLITNSVPHLVCKDIDSYPSHNTWMPLAVCVVADEVIPNYRCGCCQQPEQLKVSRAEKVVQVGGGRGRHEWNISKFFYLAQLIASLAAAHPYRSWENPFVCIFASLKPASKSVKKILDLPWIVETPFTQDISSVFIQIKP